MEQVRNEQTIYSAAVYCRLSKDDEQAGESVSIETQKMMLTDFCHERGSMANGTTTIDYEYNADGIRTKKTVTTASNHTHVFQSNVVAPTCTENGHTLHVCSCGYIYQDSPVAATGHTFTTRVIDATCTENGYTLKECACGYSYQEGSNGHNFTTLVVEPTETVNGFTRHTCACGYSYESDPVVSLCTDEGAELPATADTTVYDYIYNGSSLTQLTITTTAYGESPVTETLYFGNGTVTYNGTVYYYVTNLQGDIVAILDTTGTAVVEYSYDAWGNILTTTGSMANTLGIANPLTYRGYVYDAESALYYLQSRYYNPEVGRFINADSLVSTGQGFLGNNMFAYCLNSPIMLSDSGGMVAVWAIVIVSVGDAAIDALIAGALSALGALATGSRGGDIFASFWYDASETFIFSILDADNIVVAFANAISTYGECRRSGGNWTLSLLAAGVSFCEGFGLGTTGDAATDLAVQLVFGTGLSLSSTAITEAVKQPGKAVKTNVKLAKKPYSQISIQEAVMNPSSPRRRAYASGSSGTSGGVQSSYICISCFT